MNKQLLIYVYKHGRPSMKKLFKILQLNNLSLIIKSVRFNGFIIRDNPNNLLKKVKVKADQYKAENSIIIRWGSRVPLITDDKTIVYNKAENINISNNKGDARILLQNNNVPVPKTYLSENVLNQDLKYPMIGRPSHHGQGRHFYICNNQQDIKNAINKGCSYFSEFYNKTKEYGVHCAHGKILAVVEKPKPEDNKMAWNRALNNDPFVVLKWSEVDYDVCNVALQSLKVLKLDFGRVDIMAFPEDNNLPKVVVCEVNTAPTLTSAEYVSERWSSYFKWLFSSEKRRIHWDFTKYKKKESFFWKNFQFEQNLEQNLEENLEENI
jgi:hypothetical protein